MSENELEEQFETYFENKISPDDIENMSATLKDLKALSPDILDVTIVGDDLELKIEFMIKSGDKNPDYFHLYLERDEDFDCWRI